VVGRGPDCEPLLASVDAVAAIAPGLLATAERVYRAELER